MLGLSAFSLGAFTLPHGENVGGDSYGQRKYHYV